jgi:formylmethanofuran dehydrogenase subunit B
MKPYNKTVCPHCGSNCHSIKTKQQTRMVREVTYACQNVKCGFMFVAQINPIRTIVPSQEPSPDIHIPKLV